MIIKYYYDFMIKTRFAPSPTGLPESIHLGFIVRALWSYAWAKKNNGQFLLRIEDTDRARSRKDTEEAIISTLHDFKLDFDQFFRQSDNLARYQEIAHKLVNMQAAYYDFDSEKREKSEIKAQYEDDDSQEGLKEKPQARKLADEHLQNNSWDKYLQTSKERIAKGDLYVVRPMIPYSGRIKWRDIILKKEIEFDFKEIQDLVILKSDGFPTYHLAVVVDDSDEEITDVMRGFEWLSTTPIHLFLYDKLGLTRPRFWHFPVIMDPRTGKKFSKRDMEGMFGVRNWLQKGYLKESLLNYLMLLGWAPKPIEVDGKTVYPELFSLEEFITAFDEAGIQRSNPTFDAKKLDWFQGQYIRKLSISELREKILEFVDTFASDEKSIFTNIAIKQLDNIISLLQERTLTLLDFVSEIKLFTIYPNYSTVNISEIKGVKDIDRGLILEILGKLEMSCKNLKDQEIWEQGIRTIAEEYSLKAADVFMLLRLAMWGKPFSPPLRETMTILGEDICIDRLSMFRESL